jgi:glutaredoxin
VASVPTVTLYGKPGCHLCDEARGEIERLRGEHSFDLEQVDITLDPALNRRYGERIPVLALDGEELCELGIDGDALLERLDRVDV